MDTWGGRREDRSINCSLIDVKMPRKVNAYYKDDINGITFRQCLEGTEYSRIKIEEQKTLNTWWRKNEHLRLFHKFTRISHRAVNYIKAFITNDYWTGEGCICQEMNTRFHRASNLEVVRPQHYITRTGVRRLKELEPYKAVSLMLSRSACSRTVMKPLIRHYRC